MFLFLTVVQAIVAAALVGVILMQRSEGGGLGVGGSPSGMLSARGAADFLTRSTKWLAILFVVLSIGLAAVAVETTGGDAIESTLDRTVAPAAPADPLGPATTDQPAATGQEAPANPDPLATPAE
ncbi:MAG: preprotein translocase subunit SecG [Pseudomonadota bacterium]|uniref:Protein-export membrane protein SecG n=1 Tax=Qipengyuania pacifica TaxID=2860199 RepID=A0ABS7JGK6_9SPHN|nr:preprotein translocase subunit SecG [Qipengyuania aerophila]MEC7888753.1 preprotein translocase subunit SecG [Pseudomonadota bacterium]HAD17200.1 preprotein translocase subunit SecG [Erythrobacter sp.]MBX7489160.1 preprotein translocase subunit SecG [Qipengyuania aerophila]MEC7952071.1 preprotein translocase subunit SecG [Pseudomonadota bacterium]MEE2793969.1 preprotein translocase subunit SecG [Pseudomonadota bacterium]